VENQRSISSNKNCPCEPNITIMFPDAGQASKNVCQKLFILCTELWKNYGVLTSSNTVREQVKCKNTEIKPKATCQNVCVAENT